VPNLTPTPPHEARLIALAQLAAGRKLPVGWKLPGEPVPYQDPKLHSLWQEEGPREPIAAASRKLIGSDLALDLSGLPEEEAAMIRSALHLPSPSPVVAWRGTREGDSTQAKPMRHFARCLEFIAAGNGTQVGHPSVKATVESR
jgi:hypothetical protein